MANILKAKGLFTNYNELSAIPTGALLKADNVNVDREDIIEPRRGLGKFDTSPELGSYIKQLMVYKGRLLRHYSNKLQVDSNGAGDFDDLAGTHTEAETDLRTKFTETQGNLYFTSNVGVKKISEVDSTTLNSTTEVTLAGIPLSLDLQALVVNGASGFLPAQSKVAYRLIWGRKDNNEIPHLGAPGDRIVVGNISNEQGTYQKQSYDINTDDKTLINLGTAGTSYIQINSANNTHKYVIGYKTLDIDLISGDFGNIDRIQIPIDIIDAAFTTADQYAAITVNTLKSHSQASQDFNVYAIGSTIYFENTEYGSCDTIVSSDGNFDIEVQTYGSKLDAVPANVQITSYIPTEILNAVDPTQYYYQLYRSKFDKVVGEASYDSLAPSDEMNLVYENNVTASDVTATKVVIEDKYFETLRDSALPLYTNAFNGDGSVQGNYRPPVCKDIEQFSNIVWYANTRSEHRLNVDLLGLDDFAYYVIAYQVKAGRLILYTASTPPSTLSGQIKISGIPGVNPTTVYTINFVHTGNNPYIRISTTAGLTDPTSYTTLENYASIRKNQDKYISVTKGTTRSYLIDGRNSIQRIELGLSSFTFNAQDVDPGAPVTQGYRVTTSSDHGLSIGDTVFMYGDITGRIPVVYVNGTAQFFYVDPSATLVNTPLQQGMITSNTAWLLDSANDERKYYVYFDFTGNTPTPINTTTENRLPIRVDMTQVNTVAQFWDAVRNAVNVIDDFNIEAPTTVLSPFSSIARVIRSENGPVTIPFESKILTLVAPSVDLFGAELLPVVASAGDQTGDFTFAGYQGQITLSRKITADANGLTARSIVKAINSDASGAVYAYYISAANDLPGKMEFVSRVVDEQPFKLDFSPTTLNSNFSPVLYNLNSTNEVKANRIYYSKVDKPEAVSPANYMDVGAQDKAILRVLALRDNLFVLKEDGIYTISTFGGVPSARLLDKSSYITVADSAVVLNNNIYCLSSQGVLQIGVSGVQIVSRHWENLITNITYKLDYKANTFGVSYESDKAYILFMPTIVGDTSSTQAFRYNVFSNSWTRWTVPATCGIINPDDEKLYLGYGDGGFTLKERKDGMRTDYSDLDYTGNILANGVNAQEISMSTVNDVEVTDALVQYQYVSISKFNALLRRLDLDAVVQSTFPTIDFENDYLASIGDECYSKVNALREVFSQSHTLNSSSTITQVRDDYNLLIDYLNDSGPTIFKDYKKIETSDLTYTEGLVIKKYTYISKVDMNYEGIPFWAGEVTIAKGIKTDVEWAPDAFTVPEKMKQISSGSIIFSGNQFYGASVGFASDLSKNYEFIDFVGFGSGAFGLIPFGHNTFGGEGNDVPFRTLIPLEKQRCRYIFPRFKHQYARELFRILGYSFNVRIVSDRAYRDK